MQRDRLICQSSPQNRPCEHMHEADYGHLRISLSDRKPYISVQPRKNQVLSN